ncbi:MAG: dihydrolipoyl dehydrogenase [Saprospiraceae bacterium]|nr:dihydrolipoyl dehydrogenase [Saprospiraceae bacterium]
MQYDVVIIGSGPGGYVAAIRAAQLGLKTALVEKYKSLGGTCLNVGCIPSKALLDSSEHYHNAEKNFEQHGIILKSIVADLARMVERKNEVVSQTVSGIEFLMKKNKIDVLHGIGSFKDPHNIVVTDDEGKTTELSTKKTIIATGSKPITPAAFNYDKKRVITSTEALQISKLPKKMVVIGGGVIGLELGSVFARLGTEVVVVEYLERIIAGMDVDCSRELTKSLKKLGMTFHLSHMVTKVQSSKTNVAIEVQKRDSDETFELKADYCLVAIGRRPFTDGLDLDKAGVKLDEKGRVIVDESCLTSHADIYAIGDVIRGAMLAHKAEEEGILVVEQIAGQKPHINYNLIPGVVYTWPEVASVGYTEDTLKEKGVEYKVGKFPYKALGRARASMDIDGMVKILADKKTDEVLGVHIVGARAADMISEAVVAMEFRASAEDIARMSHAHPTYTEAIKEAALMATENRALHI